MSTKISASKAAGKIIAVILIVLILAAAIGLIVKYTGGLTSDFKTFYVSVDGKDVMTAAGGYQVTKETPLRVDTKYTFASSEGSAQGYLVKVVPNPVDGKDFDFTLDGDPYSFQAETDLTKGFDIVQEDTYFTISPKGGVMEVLQAVYPDYEVGDCADKGYADMYALVVSSYNGASSVTLYFSVPEKVTGVELSEEVIYF